MNEHRNPLGQPIGFPVEGWTARPTPPRTPMIGRWCRVEPLDVARHAAALHEANLDDADGRNWTYLRCPPAAIRCSTPSSTREAARRWASPRTSGSMRRTA
jgi:hypothetical protein